MDKPAIARLSGLAWTRNLASTSGITSAISSRSKEIERSGKLPFGTAACRRHGRPFLVLGLGSNVLVPDAGVAGVVARFTGELKRVSIDGCRVEVGAGLPLAQLARRTAAAGLSGLEALSGFPSTVGGAVVMNAGCYGTEISEVLERVSVVDREGARSEWTVADLAPGYRRTALQGSGSVVTSAVLRLSEGDRDASLARIDELNRKRWESLPSGVANAGSIFKNPEGDFAGRLVEACGLKGRRCGGARISLKHGNVIVNEGGATADDVLALMLAAYRAVVETTGVRLEPELVLLGALRERWVEATSGSEANL